MAERFSKDAALKRALALQSGRGKRSSMYLWMRDNFDVLRGDIERNGAQWDERVRLMREAGLLDGAGKPPTVRGARQSWYRLTAEVERKGRVAIAPGKPVEELPQVARSQVQIPVTPKRPMPALSDGDDEFTSADPRKGKGNRDA